MNVLGLHYLLELKDCEPQILDDLEAVKQILLEAARKSQATIIDYSFRKFSPQGISGIIIIAESHFSIHTWPEYSYAAIDIFTCGEVMDPLSAVGYIIEKFKSKNPAFIKLKRGLMSIPFESLSHRISLESAPEDEKELCERFFIDFITPSSAHLIKAKKLLFSAKTKYQEIEIFDTVAFGKCLLLDGRMQSAELDEFIYHEALVHPAMITHSNPKSVLIIGGGEGATLREALKYKTVGRCLMLDIDQQVVEASRIFLPTWNNGAFEDERTEIAYADARKYLETHNEKFDVILIDITEPIENTPAYYLVTKEMYQLIKEHLKEGGVMAQQAGSTSVSELHIFASLYKTISSVFSKVRTLSLQIPSFSLPWGIIVASDVRDPAMLKVNNIDKRIQKLISNGSLKYYNGEVHRSMLVQPPFFKEALAKQGKLILDSDPLGYRPFDYAIEIY
jgi:spermidine synthase